MVSAKLQSALSAFEANIQSNKKNGYESPLPFFPGSSEKRSLRRRSSLGQETTTAEFIEHPLISPQKYARDNVSNSTLRTNSGSLTSKLPTCPPLTCYDALAESAAVARNKEHHTTKEPSQGQLVKNVSLQLDDLSLRDQPIVSPGILKKRTTAKNLSTLPMKPAIRRNSSLSTSRITASDESGSDFVEHPLVTPKKYKKKVRLIIPEIRWEANAEGSSSSISMNSSAPRHPMHVPPRRRPSFDDARSRPSDSEYIDHPLLSARRYAKRKISVNASDIKKFLASSASTSKQGESSKVLVPATDLLKVAAETTRPSRPALPLDDSFEKDDDQVDDESLDGANSDVSFRSLMNCSFGNLSGTDTLTFNQEEDEHLSLCDEDDDSTVVMELEEDDDEEDSESIE